MDSKETRKFCENMSAYRRSFIPTNRIDNAVKYVQWELRDFTYEEVKSALADNPIPMYPFEMRKFISKIKETCILNRRPQEEEDKEYEEAIARWRKAIGED